MTVRPRALIVGAGFGGLAAGLALQRSGAAVTLLDRADGPGGKAAVASAQGVTFDTGPSLFTLPVVLETLLRAAGWSLADLITLRPLEPAFEYRYPDGVSLVIHRDADATLAGVRDTLGAAAADDFRTVHAHARSIWTAAAPHFVFGDAPSPRSILSGPISALRALRRIDPLGRMATAIERRVTSPHLRAMFYRYATYNGSDVRFAPATLLCIAHVELGLGAYGVLGGLNAVATALADAFARAGGEIVYNAHVSAITVDHGRARGIELEDGRRFAADLVVSNADTAHLTGELLPSARHGGPTKRPPSMSAFNAVVLSRKVRTAPHTVLFPTPRRGQSIDDAYLDEFRAIFDHERLPTSPTIYACDQRLAHGRGDPSGLSPLFVMVNAPSASRTTTADFSALEAHVLERLTAAGLIDAGDEVVWRRTPRGLVDRFPGSDGSLYGAASNSLTSAFRRPTNRVSGVRGLYVASGTAHPGGGVPLALLSGMAAARAALEDLGHKADAARFRVQ